MAIFQKIKRLLGTKQTHQNYWDQRAARFGERSVVNINDNSSLEEITNFQEGVIFPILKAHLLGNEKTILDFGCGPGRFTAKLAKITGARAFGADTTKKLVELARKNDDLSNYFLIKKNKLPLADFSIDVVWICLVMGGIPQEKLTAVVAEINRVLTSNGLMVLIENTSIASGSNFWSCRSTEEYFKLFEFIDLKETGNYKELGHDISIMIGRKR
jgi:SAM-dependent methyltransferase